MDDHRGLRILSIKYHLPPASLWQVKPLLSDFDIYCIHSFFATLCVECDLVTFADVVDQTANVNKNFFLRRVVNYETKSFRFVEEFYCACVHCKDIENCDVATCRRKGMAVIRKSLIFNIINKNNFSKTRKLR